MADTPVDLYRSLRKEQFPDGIFDGENPAPGVLDPDFYPKALPDGKTRAADVEIAKIKGVEWVKSGGGTSLFDKRGVFKGKNWLSFEIPVGTPIPESLVVNNTGYNKRFEATHFQIESKAGMMTKIAMQGALDNFARAAIQKAVALGRLSLSI